MQARSDDSFRVSQIDHVELFVPDRHEAADWYGRVLGLRIVRRFSIYFCDPYGHWLELTTYDHEETRRELESAT